MKKYVRHTLKQHRKQPLHTHTKKNSPKIEKNAFNKNQFMEFLFLLLLHMIRIPFWMVYYFRVCHYLFIHFFFFRTEFPSRTHSASFICKRKNSNEHANVEKRIFSPKKKQQLRFIHNHNKNEFFFWIFILYTFIWVAHWQHNFFLL